MIQLCTCHTPALTNYMNFLMRQLMTYVNGFVPINCLSMPKKILHIQ